MSGTSPTPEESPGWSRRGGPGGPRAGLRRRALYDRRLQRGRERWSLPGRLLAALVSHPGLVTAVGTRKGPVVRDGRVLHPGVQALLELTDLLNRSTGGESATDPVANRAAFVQTARWAMPSRTDVHAVGRRIPGPEGRPDLPVRIYRRFGVGVGRDAGRPSAIVYFHGGGWVVGDLDSHDGSCRLLAATTGCVVVAVDYRLAPEHPYPAAVEDCLAAYAWVHRHLAELGCAPGRVGVMGDSAGGNLAAVVALETRPGRPAAAEDVPPPVAQGLVYPTVDARLATESVRTFADGFFLTREGMETFRDLYLPDASLREEPRVSPLLAPDHGGAAPALVVTAGFDPLRDEGAAYAEALRAAGVDVTYTSYADQVHGFFGMGVVPDCLALATEVCDAMGSLMHRSAASPSV